jgi:hypothetical protein
MSKSIYRWDHPDNAILFNAYIHDEDDKCIWAGDIDLTRDADDIRECARELGCQIFIYGSSSSGVPLFITDGRGKEWFDSELFRTDDSGIILSTTTHDTSTEDSEPDTTTWDDIKIIQVPIPRIGRKEPLFKLYDMVAKELDISVKDINVSDIGLSKSDYLRLRRAERKFVEKSLGEIIHPAKMIQSWRFHWFNYCPICLADVESGFIYIKEGDNK